MLVFIASILKKKDLANLRSARIAGGYVEHVNIEKSEIIQNTYGEFNNLFFQIYVCDKKNNLRNLVHD